MLRLKTLGGLSLWRGTEQVGSAAAPPHALHCLAVIGLAGDRVVGADDVIALLWPDRPRDTARADFAALVAALPAWLGGIQPIQEAPEGHRLYGLIGRDLGYAYDMAAMGQPLQAHVSAQLKRVR